MEMKKIISKNDMKQYLEKLDKHHIKYQFPPMEEVITTLSNVFEKDAKEQIIKFKLDKLKNILNNVNDYKRRKGKS